jgi:hypothetical protein
MTQELAIALAQINPTVGDVAGNLIKIRDARAKAAALKADLVVFGELVLSGYPPEDLVLKPAFQARCRAAVESLAGDTADGGPAMIVGSPWQDGGALRNAALLLAIGPLVGFFGHGYFSALGAMGAELFPAAVRTTAQGFGYNAGRALSGPDVTLLASSRFVVRWLEPLVAHAAIRVIYNGVADFGMRPVPRQHHTRFRYRGHWKNKPRGCIRSREV